MADIKQDANNIPELQSPFDQLREVDTDGKELCSSRKLVRVMGYGKYYLTPINNFSTIEQMDDCNLVNTNQSGYIK